MNFEYWSLLSHEMKLLALDKRPAKELFSLLFSPTGTDELVTTGRPTADLKQFIDMLLISLFSRQGQKADEARPFQRILLKNWLGFVNKSDQDLFFLRYPDDKNRWLQIFHRIIDDPLTPLEHALHCQLMINKIFPLERPIHDELLNQFNSQVALELTHDETFSFFLPALSPEGIQALIDAIDDDLDDDLKEEQILSATTSITLLAPMMSPNQKQTMAEKIVDELLLCDIKVIPAYIEALKAMKPFQLTDTIREKIVQFVTDEINLNERSNVNFLDGILEHHGQYFYDRPGFLQKSLETILDISDRVVRNDIVDLLNIILDPDHSTNRVLHAMRIHLVDMYSLDSNMAYMTAHIKKYGSPSPELLNYFERYRCDLQSAAESDSKKEESRVLDNYISDTLFKNAMEKSKINNYRDIQHLLLILSQDQRETFIEGVKSSADMDDMVDAFRSLTIHLDHDLRLMIIEEHQRGFEPGKALTNLIGIERNIIVDLASTICHDIERLSKQDDNSQRSSMHELNLQKKSMLNLIAKLLTSKTGFEFDAANEALAALCPILRSDDFNEYIDNDPVQLLTRKIKSTSVQQYPFIIDNAVGTIGKLAKSLESDVQREQIKETLFHVLNFEVSIVPEIVDIFENTAEGILHILGALDADKQSQLIDDLILILDKDHENRSELNQRDKAICQLLERALPVFKNKSVIFEKIEKIRDESNFPIKVLKWVSASYQHNLILIEKHRKDNDALLKSNSTATNQKVTFLQNQTQIIENDPINTTNTLSSGMNLK